MAEPKLERYRGDNYPIEVELTRDGTWNLVGCVVTMTFVFADKVPHSFTGEVLQDDEIKKLVKFLPTVESVSKARRGKFDVQVDDGAFVTTHLKGAVEIKQDLTK